MGFISIVDQRLKWPSWLCPPGPLAWLLSKTGEMASSSAEAPKLSLNQFKDSVRGLPEHGDIEKRTVTFPETAP